MGEKLLGIQSRGAAGPSGGDRLTVAVVHEVTTGEHPGDIGERRAAFDEDVALVVEVDDPLDQLVARVVSDRDKQAGDREFTQFACLGVA